MRLGSVGVPSWCRGLFSGSNILVCWAISHCYKLPELECDTQCTLPCVVQFMFLSFPPKYRSLSQPPFIKVRSVDVLPHTKHNEPHQRNSVTVTDPLGVCVVQLYHRTGTVMHFWQQNSLTTDCIFLFPGWPLLSAETRAFCRLLPVTKRLWGQF
jgi:hypothetical protein